MADHCNLKRPVNAGCCSSAIVQRSRPSLPLQVPRPVIQLLKAACWTALAAAFWMAQAASPGVRTAGSLAVGALIGLYGYRKGSLSGSGASNSLLPRTRP